MKKIEIDYFGKKLSIETGKMAKQADGSVVVRYGDTTVLVAAVGSHSPATVSFFPLTCVYQIKTYSQGRISGGFIKRESKPPEMETLGSRMIDRPIRPLFEEGFNSETQVIATVLSYDDEANPMAAAMLGASAALYISDIPYHTPIAGVTVGRIDGEFIVNPTQEELEISDINLFVVAREEALVMVEAGAKQVSEEDMLAALEFGHKSVLPLIELQEELRKEAGKEKRTVEYVKDTELEDAVSDIALPGVKEALKITTKMERYAAMGEVVRSTVEELAAEEDNDWEKGDISPVVDDIKKKVMREQILKKKKRVDGRGLQDVRPIDCELALLPRAHGSSLFTRGETQALVTTTLGTKDDEQMVDDATGLHFKKFYLHYNFPSYSVGETGRMGPPGRREIGHGHLAERGLRVVLPPVETFPYTIRLVSEILESNGSSSMASVCGGSLAMMDAGVPITEPVAGIAMGLISEGKKTAILTDILGDEDHIGDMDFKVVGTQNGITALQMDIKVDGLSTKLLSEALEQARVGRLHILGEMEKVISTARESVSSNAPRFIQHRIPSEKIRDVIGPGGKVIKSIVAETGAKIEIDDSGIVTISSSNQKSAENALAIVRSLTKEIEIGVIYDATVKKIVEFGAIVELGPNMEGLVHISEIAKQRIKSVSDVLSEGEAVKVKAIGFDNRGRVRLSIKAVTA